MLAAVLILLTAAIRPLGRLIERIPGQHRRRHAGRHPAASGHGDGRAGAASAPLLVLPLIALFLVARALVPTLASLIVLVAGALLAWSAWAW